MAGPWRIAVVLVAAGLACARPTQPGGTAPAPAPVEPGGGTAVEAPPQARAHGLGAAEPCTRGYLHPLDAAAIAALPAAAVVASDAFDRASAPGTRRVVEGWPVHWHACPPCPEGAACKPCESYVVLAESPAVGIKQPITVERDLWIMMREPASLVRGTAYRVVVDVCDGPSPIGDTPHLEWRGAVAAPRG